MTAETWVDANDTYDIGWNVSADKVCSYIEYPSVSYGGSDTVRDVLDSIINDRMSALTKTQISLNTTSSTKETKNNKENNMKNVLFLAPGYAYAKSVISNQSKELDRKKIPYNASTDYKDTYIRTDKVHIEFVFTDPIKWTSDLFEKRDAIFGKKELVNKAKETFYRANAYKHGTSLSAYIREAHADDIRPEPVKPRETYIPEIKNVYFNGLVTVVMWVDGTKTTIRCQEGDAYSAESGLALCIAKKALGNMPNFNNVFKKWIPEEKE